MRALVDLVVPDFGADWVSQLVTWLVALPAVTGEAFPSLNRYAEQLTAVGFGLLGATFIAGLLQLWAGGLSGTSGAGESVKRAAIAAGALVSYPVVLETVLVGTNVLTAQMIRHPLVQDGLDKAFGAALVVGAVTGGLSLGLAVGAALVVLYFVAALIVLKLGLTTALSVAHVSGALVWGVYALPQTAWLARAWTAAVVAAVVVPIAWACVFAAAALLAADTLVFDGGGRHNNALGDALSYLVKPLAAVACFWLAYRAPGFLLGLARSAGLGGVVAGRTSFGGDASAAASGAAPTGHGPGGLVRRGIATNADRFRALRHIAGRSLISPATAGPGPSVPPSPGAAESAGRGVPDARGRAHSAVRSAATAVRPLVRANRWWRELPGLGRSLLDGDDDAGLAGVTAKPPSRASGSGRNHGGKAASSPPNMNAKTPAPAAVKRERHRAAQSATTARMPKRSASSTSAEGRSPATANREGATRKSTERRDARLAQPAQSRPRARTTTPPSPTAPRADSAASATSPTASAPSARRSSAAASTALPHPPAMTTTSQTSTRPARGTAGAAPARTSDRPPAAPSRPPSPPVRTVPPDSAASAEPRPPQSPDDPRRRP